MADNENTEQEKPSSLDSMLKQVEQKIKNAKLKEFEQKVMAEVKIRDEHQRGVDQQNAKIDKMFADAKKGIF